MEEVNKILNNLNETIEKMTGFVEAQSLHLAEDIITRGLISNGIWTVFWFLGVLVVLLIMYRGLSIRDKDDRIFLTSILCLPLFFFITMFTCTIAKYSTIKMAPKAYIYEYFERRVR